MPARKVAPSDERPPKKAAPAPTPAPPPAPSPAPEPEAAPSPPPAPEPVVVVPQPAPEVPFTRQSILIGDKWTTRTFDFNGAEVLKHSSKTDGCLDWRDFRVFQVQRNPSKFRVVETNKSIRPNELETTRIHGEMSVETIDATWNELRGRLRA